MPKLLTFGVCRQAIIDSRGGGVSLISLINNLTVIKRSDELLLPDGNSPIEWAIVTAWLRFEEDKDKTFEQRSLLITPNGASTELGRVLFNFAPSLESRVMTNAAAINGFPIWQDGIVVVRIDLREADSEAEWKTIDEYPIGVIHQIQEEAPVVPT